MPLFDDEDFFRADSDEHSELVDLTYTLDVEGMIIDQLGRSLAMTPNSLRWLALEGESVLESWRIPSPPDDEDIFGAVVLSCTVICRNLIGSIHEDSVFGLLSHLALIHDHMELREEWWSELISPKDLLAQLVRFAEPTDELSVNHAMMNIINVAFDQSGLVIPDVAIDVAKYLMLISLAVLNGEDSSCNEQLLRMIKEDHEERCLQPIIQFPDQHDDESSC